MKQQTIITILACALGSAAMPGTVQAVNLSEELSASTMAINDSTTTQPADSLKYSLQEVTVKSQSVIRKGNLTELYPTRRDKRFAAGGVDVLSNMNLPEITVDPMTGEVRSSDGESVSMFIDYIPASGQQLHDIRTQDIVRIDIIRNPSDSRFQGARMAVNYIMKKYEYGGYTKANGDQFFPMFQGKYGLYSKFSYKKMTYDLSTGIDYTRDGNETGIQSVSHYKFDTGEIERTERTDQYKRRSLSPRVSARAIYSGKKMTLTNSIGFNYSRVKPYEYHGTVDYSDIFESSENSRTASSHNRGAVWNGNYYFRLNPTLSLSVDGHFDATENHDNSTYRLTGDAPIVNDITEKILNGYGWATLTKQLGRHSVSLSGAGGWKRNKLDYKSSANREVYYRKTYGQVRAEGVINPVGFYISPSVTLRYHSERMNDKTFSSVLPQAFVPVYKQLTNRSSINGAFEFSIGYPEATNLSPVLIHRNEIDAVRGNEDLGKFRLYRFVLGYSQNFGPWLSARVDGELDITNDEPMPIYRAEYSADGRPMMVRDVINGGNMRMSRIKATLKGQYLDNKLSLSLSGWINNFNQSGVRNRDRWSVDGTFMATYYLGDFQLSGYITPSATYYSLWSDPKRPMYWFVSAAYSWNDLYIGLRFSNPFRKSYESGKVIIDTADYKSEQTNFAFDYHQFVKLTLSYSFGYGKKVNRQNEIDKLEGSQSIILK